MCVPWAVYKSSSRYLTIDDKRIKKPWVVQNLGWYRSILKLSEVTSYTGLNSAVEDGPTYVERLEQYLEYV